MAHLGMHAGVYMVVLVAYMLQWVAADDKDVYMKYKVQAWNQPRSTAKYLYQNNLPALSEMTACWRYEDQTPEEFKGTASKYIAGFSISLPGDYNAFVFGSYPGSNLSRVTMSSGTYEVSTDASHIPYWFGNHKHCLTWKAGGSFKWYVDKSKAGKLELIAESDAPEGTLAAGGKLVMMHDQDSYGGSFQLNQMGVGRMSEINMWNREKSAEEVMSLTCDDVGDMVSNKTLREGGSGETWYESTDVDQYIFTDTVNTQCEKVLMRRVPYKIYDTVLSTATGVPSDANCALLCMGKSSCHTVEVEQLEAGGSKCILYGGEGTKASLEASSSTTSVFYSSIVIPDNISELKCFGGCGGILYPGKLSGWQFLAL